MGFGRRPGSGSRDDVGSPCPSSFVSEGSMIDAMELGESEDWTLSRGHGVKGVDTMSLSLCGW